MQELPAKSGYLTKFKYIYIFFALQGLDGFGDSGLDTLDNEPVVNGFAEEVFVNWLYKTPNLYYLRY